MTSVEIELFFLFSDGRGMIGICKSNTNLTFFVSNHIYKRNHATKFISISHSLLNQKIRINLTERIKEMKVLLMYLLLTTMIAKKHIITDHLINSSTLMTASKNLGDSVLVLTTTVSVCWCSTSLMVIWAYFRIA